LVECAKLGIQSIGLDANPFAVFAARVKSQFDLDPDALIRATARVEKRYRISVSSNRRFTDDLTYRYLVQSGMLERGWISKRPLRKALALKDAILRGRDPTLVEALMLALVADLPTNIGNMKFGPQIYRGPAKEDVDPLPLLWSRVDAMVNDLRAPANRMPFSKPNVLLGDARTLRPILRKHFTTNLPQIGFVICSPPYPTEHDYTRHTRLELAFTDSVTTLGCLQTIKRTMIRSHTKGIYKGDEDEQRIKGNAWDAQAHNVEIRTGYPHFVEMTISDDGDGFDREEFLRIVQGGLGNSEKRIRDEESPSERPLIGRLGVGMFGIAQICGSFVVSSNPKSGEPFKARVRLYSLLKEELDKSDSTLVRQTGSDDDGFLEIHIGEYDMLSFDPEEFEKSGTRIVADVMHPVFSRTFREAILLKDGIPLRPWKSAAYFHNYARTLMLQRLPLRISSAKVFIRWEFLRARFSFCCGGGSRRDESGFRQSQIVHRSLP
jgi:hypothetical protein